MVVVEECVDCVVEGVRRELFVVVGTRMAFPSVFGVLVLRELADE